jgi:hypothetical protein
VGITRKLTQVAICRLSLAVAGGCGDAGGPKPPMGKVKGTVTYNGRPLPKVVVTFVPIVGKGGDTGQSASGTTESDGTFVLTTFNTGDGAIAGQHAATVKEDLVATSSGKTGKDGQKHMPDFSKAGAQVVARPLVPAK